MNERAGMRNGADTEAAAGLDAQGAAAIMQEARERARHELAVRRPVLFVSWGLALLVGYGAMWLSVRGQGTYHVPAWPTLLLTFLLLVVAATITAQVVDRATSGVGGSSALQQGIFCLSLAAGFAVLEIEKQALAAAGASLPVAALFGQAIPLLVTGLVFVTRSAVNTRVDWPRLALGLWLLAVAAGGAWAGPVTNLAVIALAGGGGILLMAAIEPRLRRS